MAAYSESALRTELLGEGVHAPNVEHVISALQADGAFSPGSPGGTDALFEILPAGDSTPTNPDDEVVKFLSAGTGPFTGAGFTDGGTHLDAIVFNTDDNVSVDLTRDGTLVSRALSTGAGDDSVSMTGNAQHLIDVGDGANFVVSGAGKDSITAGIGSDTIQGGAGGDTIVGGGGQDHLAGQKGNDQIFAGGDSDTLLGGQGNDKFFIHAFPDAQESVSGGAGNDKILFTDYTLADKDGPITHHGQGANKTFVIHFTDGTTVKIQSVETLVFSDGAIKHLH